MARLGISQYMFAVLLAALTATSAEAKLPPTAQRAADIYLQELRRVEHSTRRVSMQPLFALADSLDEAFFQPMTDYSPGSGEPWSEEAIAKYVANSVEGLPEAELDSLQTAMRGVHIFVGDYTFTYLDTQFFLELAKAHGLPADVDFLMAYAGRYLGSESVQDCVHFGTDLLVNQYGAWATFRARHPRDYTRFAADEVQDVMEQLMGDCACGDSSSVDSELDHFLRRFPKDPIAPKVRARLATVRNGSSGITFNCPPPRYR